MKQTFFIILAVFILVFFVGANNNKKINSNYSSRNNYESIIDYVMQCFSTGKKVPIDKLQNAIPISPEEFWIYYSYTDPEKGKLLNNSFDKMDLQLIKYAKMNKGLFLKLYLQLSPFVDGEYAEGYFVDVESIIEKNKSVFCKIYENLNSGSKIKLKEYKERYCK